MNGAERIAAERQRQIEGEGWTPEHDDQHKDGELAMAAIAYAAPVPVFAATLTGAGMVLEDPWPWDSGYDKRYDFDCDDTGEDNPLCADLPHPSSYSHEQRIDLLTKAGSLIAAEIDRLLRVGAEAMEEI